MYSIYIYISNNPHSSSYIPIVLYLIISWPHELADPLPTAPRLRVFVPGLTSWDMGPSLVRGALKSVATKDGNGRTRMTLITIIKKSIHILYILYIFFLLMIFSTYFHMNFMNGKIPRKIPSTNIILCGIYMNEFPNYDVFECLSMSKVKIKDIFKQNNLSGLLAVYYPSSVDSWDQNVELCRHGEPTNSRCTQGELWWNPYGNLIINNDGYTCRRIVIRTAVPEHLMVDSFSHVYLALLYCVSHFEKITFCCSCIP